MFDLTEAQRRQSERSVCPMSDLTEGAVRGGLYAQCPTLQRGPSEGVCHRGSVCPMSDLTEEAVRGGLYAQCLTLQRGLSEGVCTPNVRPYRGGPQRGSVRPMSDLTEAQRRPSEGSVCPMSDLTEGAVRGGLYAQCLTLQRGLLEGVCMPNV